MNSTVNFAIIGCGVIGPTHARSIAEIEGARLVAVSDIVEEKAQALGEMYEVDSYANYHQMLERADIDVVTIATPSGMHAEMGIAAARAGKNVIVEKPMDITLEKADALIAACHENKVKLCVISQHRFDQGIVDLKKAIQDEKLGPLAFGGAYTQWYRAQEYYDSGSWRGTWALDGGGSLMNQSIHYVDLLQYIMGPVEEIYAYCARRAHVRIEVEDVSAATVKFKSGAIGIIEGMTAAYPGFAARLDIFGGDGGVIIENDRVKEWRLSSGEEYAQEVFEAPLIVGTSSADIWYLGHRRQIQDMVDAIREDRPPMVTGEEGRKPLEIILAIYQSARTGQPVKPG